MTIVHGLMLAIFNLKQFSIKVIESSERENCPEYLFNVFLMNREVSKRHFH